MAYGNGQASKGRTEALPAAVPPNRTVSHPWTPLCRSPPYRPPSRVLLARTKAPAPSSGSRRQYDNASSSGCQLTGAIHEAVDMPGCADRIAGGHPCPGSLPRGDSLLKPGTIVGWLLLKNLGEALRRGLDPT
jgi:hypothetical protein